MRLTDGWRQVAVNRYAPVRLLVFVRACFSQSSSLSIMSVYALSRWPADGHEGHPAYQRLADSKSEDVVLGLQ